MSAISEREQEARAKLAEVLGLPPRSLGIAREAEKLIAGVRGLGADSIEQFVKDKQAEYALVVPTNDDDESLRAAEAVVRDYGAAKVK